MNDDIPITIIDDFFSDPSIILECANSLDYYKPDGGNYYGERTKSLWEEDKVLASYITTQLSHIFFKNPCNDSVEFNLDLRFQRMNKTEEGFDKGWVHDDGGFATAIIYLKPDPDPNSGISFFNAVVDQPDMEGSLVKHKFYSTGDSSDYKKNFDLHHRQFVKTVDVSNRYNRCVIFGKGQLHAGNYSTTDSRLFLIVSIESALVDSSKSPNISDMRRWEQSALEKLIRIKREEKD